MLYAIIAGALFAAYHVSTTFRHPSRAPYYIAALALFLFVGFRFEVGCDWTGYYNQFRIAYWRGIDGAAEDVEPLWWAAVYLLSDLDFVWLNAFAAALFALPPENWTIRR